MFETTALGAAILAGYGSNLIEITDIDASQITKFTPQVGENGNLESELCSVNIVLS